MTKLKIVQYFINLPRDKQIPAILLFFILTSLGSNAVIVWYFRGEVQIARQETKDDKKYYQTREKLKDSIHESSQKDNIDFMKGYFRENIKSKKSLDSIKIIQSLQK